MRFLFSTFSCACVFLMFAGSRVAVAASGTTLHEHADKVAALLPPDKDNSREPAFYNDSGYSKKQILRMGLQKFLDAYTHGTRQWQWEEEAYPIYTRYKKQDNKRRIGRLHQNSRRQMTLLYAELYKWESHAFQLRYDYYAHGTAVRGIAFRWPAKYEEFIGQVLDRRIRSMRPHTQTRRKGKSAANSVDRLLHYYQQLDPHKVEHRDDFRNTLKKIAMDTKKIKPLLSALPVALQEKAARHIADFVEDVL